MARTPEELGALLGEWFSSNGITESELCDAIERGRPLVAEAIQALPWLARVVIRSERDAIAAWQTPELTRILQSLAGTHPGHARQLYAAWHAYWAPQVAEAQRLLYTL